MAEEGFKRLAQRLQRDNPFRHKQGEFAPMVGTVVFWQPQTLPSGGGNIGAVNDTGDNSYHVVTGSGTESVHWKNLDSTFFIML